MCVCVYVCVDHGFGKALQQSLLLGKSIACLAYLTYTVLRVLQHKIYKLPEREEAHLRTGHYTQTSGKAGGRGEIVCFKYC